MRQSAVLLLIVRATNTKPINNTVRSNKGDNGRRTKQQVREVFDRFVEEGSNKIDMQDLGGVLSALDVGVSQVVRIPSLSSLPQKLPCPYA